MTEEKKVWGYATPNEIEQNGGDWKWGVNQNVFLKDIEYHEETTNEKGNKVDAKVVMSFMYEESPEDVKKLMVFEPDPNSYYSNALKKAVRKGDENFNRKDAEENFKKQVRNVEKTISDILTCFVEPDRCLEIFRKAHQKADELKKEFTFKDYANVVISAIKSTNFQSMPLDLMLQYSSKLSDNGNSFLEVANGNQGHYVVRHQEGEWEEDKVPFHHYRLYKLENGVRTTTKHPISRGNFDLFWKNNAEKITVKPEIAEQKKEDFAEELKRESNKQEEIDWSEFK